MGRNRKQNKELQNALNNINESSRTVAENTGQISEKLDDIKNVTEKSSKSLCWLQSAAYRLWMFIID